MYIETIKEMGLDTRKNNIYIGEPATIKNGYVFKNILENYFLNKAIIIIDITENYRSMIDHLDGQYISKDNTVINKNICLVNLKNDIDTPEKIEKRIEEVLEHVITLNTPPAIYMDNIGQIAIETALFEKIIETVADKFGSVQLVIKKEIDIDKYRDILISKSFSVIRFA